MIFDSYFQTKNECYYMAHSELVSLRPTLLIMHGLGDSGLGYRDFINSDLLLNYNIMIPDLLGHGKSSAAKDYSFKNQVNGISQHIEYLKSQQNIELGDIILLSHSMGGIHATLFCESRFQKNVTKFISVEGSITQYGSFIAYECVKADEENNFLPWFAEFKQKVYGLGNQNVAFQRYYASLMFCQPKAFLQNAKEMFQMSRAYPGKYTHVIGKKYAELNVPRIYIHGDSMCSETLAFLKENNLAMRHYNFPTHFFMPESFDEIIECIKEA